MIVYKENKIGNQSVFAKNILNNLGEVVNSREVKKPLFQIEKEGYTYFILYDDHMNVIEDAFSFLNYALRESPLTTRSKAAFALRLLYCFLSLANLNIQSMNESNIRELLFFLRGLDSNPDIYSLKTQRSNATVNGYLSIYRTFFKYKNIECEALFRGKAVKISSSTTDSTNRMENNKFDNNLKTSNYSENSVPKYISPTEFRKIFRLAVEKKDNTTRIILHLMYGYGLRLGEVLGLTLEDIQETHENEKLIPVLLLRNRISDKKYQFSKGLSHVINKKQYSTKDYNSGKQKIIITYPLYEELLRYVEETHAAAIENHPDNYESGVADIVSIKNKPEQNHYVFLNQYGRILSDQTWNNNLKRYFRETSISLDYDIRENNLSHRFRHGFAMFHARFSEHPADILSLQKMMRHRSLSSTMVYFNPTPEDEFQIKTEFQNELYGLIPELKGALDE